MGKLSNILIILEGSKKIYRPADTVKGRISLEAEKDTGVRSIQLFLCGATLVKWEVSELNRRDNYDVVAKEIYSNEYRILFGSQHGQRTLKAGQHSYPFSFRLREQGLPSSYEGRWGATRYWLRLQISRPGLQLQVKRYRVITVLANVFVDRPPSRLQPCMASSKKAISKFLGLGNSGTLSLSATLDRSAYCPGESIAVDLLAKNDSTKDLGFINVMLIQTVQFTASNQKKTTTNRIRCIKSTKKVLKQDSVSWSAQPFLVDAVPASSEGLTCQMLRVSYTVKVEVEVPFGLDLELKFPVTVATLPLHSTATLEYRGCITNESSFSEKDGMFDNIEHKPLMVYVKNYKAKEAQAASAVTTQAFQTLTLADQGSSPAMPKLSPHNMTYPLEPTAPCLEEDNCQSTDLGVGARPKTTSGHLHPMLPAGPDSSAAGYEQKDLGSSDNTYPKTTIPPTLSSDSALQLPEAPPSYEEAVSLTDRSAPQRNPEEKSSMILVAFPLSTVSEVRQCLTLYYDSLKVSAGHVLFFCSHPLSVESSRAWDPDTSTVIFYFGSQKKAKEWFAMFVNANKVLTKDWRALVSENVWNEMPLPNPNYQVLQVTITRKTNWNQTGKQLLKECNDIIMSKIRAKSHRLLIFASGKITILKGDWKFSSLEDECTVPVLPGDKAREVPRKSNPILIMSCYQFKDMADYTTTNNLYKEDPQWVEKNMEVSKYLTKVHNLCLYG